MLCALQTLDVTAGEVQMIPRLPKSRQLDIPDYTYPFDSHQKILTINTGQKQFNSKQLITQKQSRVPLSTPHIFFVISPNI